MYGRREGSRAFFAMCLTLAVALVTGAPVLADGTGSTADHTKFKELEGPFETGPDVTRACLSCHTEAAKQVHRTKHWTWSAVNPKTGQKLGKQNTINNFCISVQSNIGSCSSCHVGYGWKDNSFDFASEENVDCLVCHDTTLTYDKKRLREGKSVNLRRIARNVGRTSRATCGTCHFRGGGGDAVKHGDLDPSMAAPDMFLDVHMDADGLNFTCATCHTTDAHMVSGSRYTPQARGADDVVVPGRGDRDRASCQACHGHAPHDDAKINDHPDRVAGATCHVPRFARGDFATKSWWDWSTAGRLDDEGKPFTVLNDQDLEVYNSKKGDFRWERDVVPDYIWFNGTVRYTLVGDTIDPATIVQVNRFEGAADDPDSRIWPVRIMRGKQPYDAVNMTMAPVHTTGKDGFWKTFDWEASVAKGMAAVGQPFSGQVGFVETTMVWPMAHMVAPTEKSLACDDCHAKDGRMASLSGMYLPGRGDWPLVNQVGFGLALLTLIGVIGHGLLRIVVSVRNRGRDGEAPL